MYQTNTALVSIVSKALINLTDPKLLSSTVDHCPEWSVIFVQKCIFSDVSLVW